jgi:signal transduction histidine kinase
VRKIDGDFDQPLVRVNIDQGSDDGKGLPAERRYGVGLSGMEERVRQLQGTFRIGSDSGGTTVVVDMPITEATGVETVVAD